MFAQDFVRRFRRLNLSALAKKYPFFLVGIPFISATLGGTLLLVPFQKSKYEYNSSRVKNVAESEKLKVDTSKRGLNLQEEYFRLVEQGAWDEYSMKRYERPAEDEPVFDA
ncbi:hypothetical protein BB560_005695 [Smittium megazygosporum]|uniref:Cytochrome c oxidase assembly protein COX16, mitochondrial n=1 Tax=Smittium megazygosporum TaxID=133381 RepID=A0A2T9Z141_9FUNG|nr:hypothetical protein BB560_005695 [Smittium megazygosporum]